MSKISLQFDELMSSKTLDIVFDIAIRRHKRWVSQQLVRDVDAIRDFIGGPAVIALCDAPWVPVFIAACFILHPYLGFVALGGAIIVFVLAKSNEILTKSKLTEANKLWLKTSSDAFISLRKT